MFSSKCAHTHTHPCSPAKGGAGSTAGWGRRRGCSGGQILPPQPRSYCPFSTHSGTRPFSPLHAPSPLVSQSSSQFRTMGHGFPITPPPPFLNHHGHPHPSPPSFHSLSSSFAFLPPYRTFRCRAQPAPNAAVPICSSSGVPALAMTWAQEILAKAPPSVPCSCSWILTRGDGPPIPQPLFSTPPALRLS